MLNPYSWNKNANIIYVDAPVGVGFSYSNTTEGLSTNDNQTASDNYAFLNGWYAEFPAFQNNDLYITGESYGGVYVPTLTYEILTSPPSVPKNKLAGLVIGNPVINCPQNEVQGPSIQIDLYYYHGLISFLSRQNWYNQGCGTTPTSPTCISTYQAIVSSIGLFPCFLPLSPHFLSLPSLFSVFISSSLPFPLRSHSPLLLASFFSLSSPLLFLYTLLCSFFLLPPS